MDHHYSDGVVVVGGGGRGGGGGMEKADCVRDGSNSSETDSKVNSDTKNAGKLVNDRLENVKGYAKCDSFS